MHRDAVILKNAHKSYGKGHPPVLDGLNMNVPRGCIYGLLGPSGCGKTTLLSCVVGVRKLDLGDIWVLGGKPGQKGSGVPGPRVGYMPQEVSLVSEFSVIGALYYFGRINGLEDSYIDERYDFFSNLLQLPPQNRLVKHLSGGEQRRISFAASLIHKPELLILDEPTVGLDPVLRENIWQFLDKLTKEEGTAVVITTHYIEETKLANKIGLLRCGQLLAETTPSALLARFQNASLEEAFLILSQRQEESRSGGTNPGDKDRDSISLEDLFNDTIPTSQSEHRSDRDLPVNSENQPVNSRYEQKNKYSQPLSMYGKIFKALMAKNFLQLLRHPGTLLLAFIFPIIEVMVFFYSIGNDPRNIIMAVVNDEAGDCDRGRYLGQINYEATENLCEYVDLSCRFLHGFNESIMVKQYFNTIEEATLAVKSGKAAGTMYFGGNFSQALQNRLDSYTYLEDDDIIASEIQMKLDMAEQPIGLFLQKNLYERFLDIHGEIVSKCNISKKVVSTFIAFEEPVFGKLDQKYIDFAAPGFILTLTFFLGSAVSSVIIITDRAEGVWDRSLVQGVTTSAILFSHIFTQMLVIMIQVTVVLVITFAYFQLSCRGSIIIVIVLVLLNSIAAMLYGLAISVLCTSHLMANFTATGSFIIITILSGTLWPVEAMPMFLRYISYFVPTTIPTFALRGVVYKGYSIFEFEVYSGFCVLISWILIFITACLLGLRRNA